VLFSCYLSLKASPAYVAIADNSGIYFEAHLVLVLKIGVVIVGGVTADVSGC